ncbi:MAG: TetR family transcriptional regulator [Rhizomicrobium sp.]
MAKTSKTTPGLRERKRAETRARIIEGALKLFVARGFDAVTLDDIAAAAGISRRTFFHYFESKEDLAFDWMDSSMDDIAAAVGREPKSLPMLTIALNAMVACAQPFPREEAWALMRLVQETPALRDRSQMKYGRLETALAAALAARKGLKPGDLKARLAAMTAAGALRVSSQAWYESGGKEDMATFARKVLKALPG